MQRLHKILNEVTAARIGVKTYWKSNVPLGKVGVTNSVTTGSSLAFVTPHVKN